MKNKKQRHADPAPTALNYRLLLVAFALGCAATAGFFFVIQKNQTQDPGASRFRAGELRQKGYHLISPLLECSDNMNDSYFSMTRDLKRRVEKELAGYKDITASVYYRDLLNGPVININPGERFSPASLTKIPIMISYLKYAEEHSSILIKKLKYRQTPIDLEVDFKPTRTLQPNETYTVERLLFHMIAYSDNGARGTLIEDVFSNASGKRKDAIAVPIDFYSEIFRDLGLDSPDMEDPQMTAKQVASFFRILYNASYLDRKHSEFALNILLQSTFDKGITQSIPRNVMVAHKFAEDYDGERRSLHECGVVYEPKRPYILCVMTRGKSNERQSELIGKVSKIIYDDAVTP